LRRKGGNDQHKFAGSTLLTDHF